MGGTNDTPSPTFQKVGGHVPPSPPPATPMVNIDINVNLFNNIYPDLNGNQSSEYYDCPKFNKLGMNSNTDLLLLNFNIRSIGANFDTFDKFYNIICLFLGKPSVI